jgi:hypothetical protein
MLHQNNGRMQKPCASGLGDRQQVASGVQKSDEGLGAEGSGLSVEG